MSDIALHPHHGTRQQSSEGLPNSKSGSPNGRKGLPNRKKGSPNGKKGSPDETMGSPNENEGLPFETKGEPLSVCPGERREDHADSYTCLKTLCESADVRQRPGEVARAGVVRGDGGRVVLERARWVRGYFRPVSWRRCARTSPMWWVSLRSTHPALCAIRGRGRAVRSRCPTYPEEVGFAPGVALPTLHCGCGCGGFTRGRARRRRSARFRARR